MSENLLGNRRLSLGRGGRRRRRGPKWLLLLVALAIDRALALGLTACGAKSGTATDDASASSSGGGGGTIIIASFPQGNTLDPWKAQASTFCPQASYDTLTRLMPDGTIGPWLATSWQYTSPTTIELKLRDDVKFSDGTAFDANAVKANLEYGQTAEPKNQGDAPFMAILKSVTAVDAQTVQVEFTTPYPNAPYDFSQQCAWMVNPKMLENPDSMTNAVDGTGAYVLDAENTVPQQTYTYTPNPDYWAADQVKRFDKVVIKIMPDPMAMANAAKAGQVNYLITPDPSVEIPGFTKDFGGPVGINGLYIQDLKGKICKPLADVRVRQAMNYAVDRQAILDGVLKGAGVVNGSVPYGPNSDGYTPELDTYYAYDPQKAKDLLAEAGYAKGFKVTILVNEQFATFAQAITGYLRKVGVDVELSAHSTDIMQQTASGKWAIASVLTSVTGQTFTDVQNLMTPASIYNPQKNGDPKIDQYLQDAAAATDATAATSIYTELGPYAQQQAWMITPVLMKTGYAFDPKVIVVDPPPNCVVADLYYLSPAQ